jgi:hypothetical protein
MEVLGSELSNYTLLRGSFLVEPIRWTFALTLLRYGLREPQRAGGGSTEGESQCYECGIGSEKKLISNDRVRKTPRRQVERNAAHCVTDDDERETTSSVATATERAIWGVGSTITAVATLWRAVVDTGALDIWSFACMGAGRPC